MRLLGASGYDPTLPTQTTAQVNIADFLPLRTALSSDRPRQQPGTGTSGPLLPAPGTWVLHQLYDRPARLRLRCTYRSAVSPMFMAKRHPLRNCELPGGLRYDIINHSYRTNYRHRLFFANGRYYGQVSDTDIDFKTPQPKTRRNLCVNGTQWFCGL